MVLVCLWAILPPALPAEGGPDAGYSGFSLERCSEDLRGLGQPQYARAPTGSQPFGRSDRPAAALSAVAICDAKRIGFLSRRLTGSSADRVFDRNGAIRQERKCDSEINSMADQL